MYRLLIFWRRFFRAKALGLWFPGTTQFSMPDHIQLCGRSIPLLLPPERSLTSDLINVVLDDEYGLRKMPVTPVTILDVGANVGLFSLWARHNFPGAVIRAYEPNSRIVPFTLANTSGLRIDVALAGLGRDDGRAAMHDPGDSRLARIVPSQQGGVEIQSLDRAVNAMGGSVDLLKMDCEGAEWELFQDVKSMARVRTIRMEYHLSAGKTLEQFLGLTRQAGFVVEHCRDKTNHGILWLKRSNGA